RPHVLVFALTCTQSSMNRCDETGADQTTTPCTSCAASQTQLCPRGFKKYTTQSMDTNMGQDGCQYSVTIAGKQVALNGCNHQCERTVTMPKCCADFWGPLCLSCPSWNGRTCNWHGTCMDGISGNGSCVCNEGYTGFACQQCSNKNSYGDNCKSECGCVNGECNNGPDGNGECYCQPPYTGPRCEQGNPALLYTRYSGAKKVFSQPPIVQILPLKKLREAWFCSAKQCDVNADCSWLGGRLFQCQCKAGYKGDGRMCVPINPCDEDNGGCPRNSTVCVYNSPGKSRCDCMHGWEGSTLSSGCTLKNVCNDTTCHPNAGCETGLDGYPRCLCNAQQIGDGYRCYGNLMERIVELDREGTHKGKLSGAILLFVRDCMLTISQQGPFTAFVPLSSFIVPLASVCQRYLVRGQYLYKSLDRTDVYTASGLQLRFKPNKQFMLVKSPETLYSVIQQDIPAANGVIHIIDQPIIPRNILPDSPKDEQFADKTIGEILTKDEKYNRFLSLVDNCGTTLPLRGPGPLTVFVPTNDAVDKFRDGRLIYMLFHVSTNTILYTCMLYHVSTTLTVDQLASMGLIQTMANQILLVNLTNDGLVLLGGKPLQITNIMASNGVIHMIDGVLVPPSIVPILPKRCDVTENKIIMVGGNILYRVLIVVSVPQQSHMKDCDYQAYPFNPTLNKGCAKYCNTTIEVSPPECCSGFYGPECKTCTGGFQTPCYGKGTCFDGIHGNGSCRCEERFKGIACHICSDPNKHGEKCDQDCLCLHGVCDNRPGSKGACRGGSCLEGYSGDYCDKEAKACNSDGLSEHCHVHAFCSFTGSHTTCECMSGYEGDGHSCILVNPCLKADRGGCDVNAQCENSGPANVSCVCNEGWTGDGLICTEVDNCLLETRGGCHKDADCRSLGPGQSECTCMRGYMGDGTVCDLINPCQKNNGGCHSLVLMYCICVCPPNEFDLSGNLTALVPSRDVIRNLTTSEQDFWFSRYRLPYLLKAHFLQGIFSIEDLDKQVNQRLPTLHLPTTWEVKTVDGEVRIENATILTPNIPSINGYIHIINTVLLPPLSDIPPEPPGLMQFLNTTPTFSLFTQAALLYNLTEEIGVYDYTLLLPHDAAVRNYLSQTNSTQLVEVLKYHVILHEQLFPNHLRDGMVKDTLLGRAYQIMFHLGKNNETLANDVLLDGSHSETRNGVILAVPQVLQVHKNRCIKDVILRVRGRCTACDEKPRCYLSYKPTIREYPQNMRSNCKFRKRVGSRRKSVAGCIVDCLKTTQDHSCCPGYFGHFCFKCPGERDNWCSGNGRCKDGNLGTGECLCKEGFHGTACETCEPGRYGKDCNSECSCAHGKCLDGVTGNGRCVCYKGWRGVNCSKGMYCSPICEPKETEGPRCQCVAGFTGNGTVCTEVNLCATGNGGCAQIANCTKTLPGERTCTCPEGYTGDGVWCLEIDGCLVNNGGCSSSAECIKTGPNWVRLHLFECQMRCRLRLCFQNNGGCGKYARCRYMGNGERNCSCPGGHIGDGFDCRGKTRTANACVLQVSDVRSLYGDGPFTTFIPPANSNFSVCQFYFIFFNGRSPDLANYHMVSCETLMLSDLKTTSKAVAVSGHQLTFSLKDGSVYINDDARIVSSDYVTADGVIHYIDKVLTPYDLKDQKAIPSKLNFTEAGELYGYMKFTKLVQDANMLNLVESSIHQPLTMLWPSDAALSSLSEERQHWLYSLAHRDKLTAIIKAHIIRNIKKMTLTSFTTYRTMHGSTFTFSCNKKVVGDMMVNDNMARVLDRFMMFNGGVAYGIDQLLEPPGLGAHCDGLEDRTIYVRDFNITFIILLVISNISGDLYPSMTRHHMGQRMGCKRMCKSQAWVMSCCKNHYGRDCQVCSGGLESPCGDHGDCDDGRLGSGRCRCHDGFKGIACDLCELKHYGTNCTACNCTNQGQCEEGMEGDGSCSCTEGWTGDRCHLKIEKKLVCSPECHSNAVCQADNICLCQSQYVGDGLNCTAPDLCAEYNGGCHQHAACLQTDLQVNCTCLSGYEGDGSVCSPINRCVTETNGGCSDFATCLFTGPNERQCECLDGYVGNGLQCLEKVVPPVDRCLEENGGCHPQATCKDLHYHSNTAGVFHLRSSAGKYQLNYTDAELACQAEGATLATFSQMADAQQLGMHRCVAGWIQGKKVGYPTRFPSVNCGDNHVGIVLYKDPVDPSSKYDTFCYRLSDVSCVCGSGYVGNGDFCNGDLASVVATNLNYSVFYNILLKYAGSSTDGEVLLDFLSSSSSYATLFVPLNAGFSENETLSDRDVEYHISTNNSITFYEDLKHDGVIPSRLGYNLSVVISPSNITQQNQEPQTFKLVNRRLVLTWDIPAYNGIIHVIEGPLRAPPLPVSHAHGGGTVATSILVTCLIVCVIAGLTYYVFKHKNDAFRFHYFKNEEGDKPALVSIPNPLYSGYRAFNQPFGINEQCVIPRLLDL
uniref:Stabilin 1 n=1 Tax=Oncorhynchus kisutch TaxID=8019 RepID=A0A8C7EZ97_ONCKI